MVKYKTLIVMEKIKVPKKLELAVPLFSLRKLKISKQMFYIIKRKIEKVSAFISKQDALNFITDKSNTTNISCVSIIFLMGFIFFLIIKFNFILEHLFLWLKFLIFRYSDKGSRIVHNIEGLL